MDMLLLLVAVNKKLLQINTGGENVNERTGMNSMTSRRGPIDQDKKEWFFSRIYG